MPCLIRIWIVYDGLSDIFFVLAFPVRTEHFFKSLTYHGLVGDVAVLLEAGLALVLLGRHVVGDVGVVALLCNVSSSLKSLRKKNKQKTRHDITRGGGRSNQRCIGSPWINNGGIRGQNPDPTLQNT